MATAKKTTVKKTVAKKAPAKKAPVAKKAPASVKKTTVTKKTTKSSAPKVKSFRVSTNQPAFTSFKITRQTVYWTILIAFIIAMQLWILSLQVETSNYIEAQQATINSES